jgi:hypothetical protein
MSSAPLGGTPEQYIIPGSTRFVSDEAYKELVDVWERFKEAQYVVMVRVWAATAQARIGCRESSLARPHTIHRLSAARAGSIVLHLMSVFCDM